MKGVNRKPVCTYCHKIIDKKPIKVAVSGDAFAHKSCIRLDNVRLDFLFGSVKK